MKEKKKRQDNDGDTKVPTRGGEGRIGRKVGKVGIKQGDTGCFARGEGTTTKSRRHRWSRKSDNGWK